MRLDMGFPEIMGRPVAGGLHNASSKMRRKVEFS